MPGIVRRIFVSQPDAKTLLEARLYVTHASTDACVQAVLKGDRSSKVFLFHRATDSPQLFQGSSISWSSLVFVRETVPVSSPLFDK